MPLDFPSSPTNGQVYQNYYYDGSAGAWRSLSSTVNPIPSTLKNLTISSTETTGVSLKVTPFTTSSVNLQEWYNTSSTVVASMNVAGDLTANELNLTGTEINGDSKTIARYSDSWLRLNPDGDFSAGIYTNTSLIRTDNGLQVGANGANFLATSSALTHNGTDILKKDMRQWYVVGAVGTGTSANYYEVYSWTATGQYNNFSAHININGRGNTDTMYTLHVRGEYGVSAWSVESLSIVSDGALADGDTWLLVFSDTAKTAKLYYRRSGSDWQDRIMNFESHYTGSITSASYTNTLFGTTAPTGDAVITKTAPDAISVVAGGTGATTLTSGGYLKGAGTGAVTSQTGIPAGDITSGTLDYSRFPSGTIVQVQSTTVTAAAAYSIGAFSLQDVGVNVTITPKSASNKIFIIANVSSAGVSFARPAIVLARNTTRIAVGNAAGSRNQISGSGAQGETAPGTQTVNFLDSPATTSAITYRAYIVNLHSATQQYNFNYDVTNSDNGSHGRTASTITVMEVVA